MLQWSVYVTIVSMRYSDQWCVTMISVCFRGQCVTVVSVCYSGQCVSIVLACYSVTSQCNRVMFQYDATL